MMQSIPDVDVIAEEPKADGPATRATPRPSADIAKQKPVEALKQAALQEVKPLTVKNV